MPTSDVPAGASTSPTPSTVLRLRGRDALPLLHRISTQALLDLGPGAARPTLFCDFRGRLLHRAVVAVASDGAVWLLRDDAPGAALAEFVDRHVFRDDVTIEDHSASRWVEAIESGPGATAGILRERGGVPEEAIVGGGCALVVRAGETAAALPEERQARERRRIRAGRPAHGREIGEAFNPFEVGLGGDVHLDKGCYTGQEALQRLVTYDSVRRRLASIEGSGRPPAAPADVTCVGERAGVLTSVVADERPDRWIGLAVLGHEFTEPGRELEVGGVRLTSAEAFPMPRALGRP